MVAPLVIFRCSSSPDILVDFLFFEQVFIYPDIKTAISGTFSEDGRLVEGSECEVDLEEKNVLSIIAFQVLAATYEQGVLVPVLSETFGPTFHYEELTSWDVERQPLMADPYECRWCQVTKFYLHQYGSHLHQH